MPYWLTNAVFWGAIFVNAQVLALCALVALGNLLGWWRV